jgi:ATP-dependent protease HslVU (ClpYQ) peptidase subunit
MDSTSQTSADDAKIKSDLFNLVEKLRIELQKRDQELQKKDEELAKERQEKQVCTAFYCL